MPQYLAEIKGNTFSLSKDEARHLKVARLRAGDKIKIFDGLGNKYLGELKEADDKSASGNIINPIPAAAPKRQIHLYFSAISRPATEDLLDKCTQAGVYAFHPVISARSDAELLKKWDTKLERWQSILLAACKQCETPLLPQIHAPVPFENAVEVAGQAIICYEAEQKISILQAVKGDTLSIFIGPEGGYTEDEIKLAQAAGIISVSLGPNILRAETAALAACWAALQ